MSLAIVTEEGSAGLLRRLSDPYWFRAFGCVLGFEAQPQDYTGLLAVPGIGAKGLRALSLVAELTYGEPTSIRDPVTFSFAHGGKDGTPYAVDRTTYDATIESLRAAVGEAKLGRSVKTSALKRLAGLESA